MKIYNCLGGAFFNFNNCDINNINFSQVSLDDLSDLRIPSESSGKISIKNDLNDLTLCYQFVTPCESQLFYVPAVNVQDAKDILDLKASLSFSSEFLKKSRQFSMDRKHKKVDNYIFH